MRDGELHERARRAGLAVEWTNAHGQTRTVSSDTLRAVLNVLGDSDPVPDGAMTDTRCFSVDEAASNRRLAAIAVQLYSLRGQDGFGNLRSLADFACSAARAGVDAVAVSPIHAPFFAASHDISPYAPSSRLFLNPFYADTGAVADEGAVGLVDWPRAIAAKRSTLKKAFEASGRPFQDVESRLADHARFEALDDYFRAQGLHSFRDWPLAYRDPRSAIVEGFAQTHSAEIGFHIFLQMIAEKSLVAAQAAARDAGMKIGIVADLAVGMSPVGSHAWSAPGEVLTGLTIGAPPDVFQPQGQNWGITALSPNKGRAAFAETLMSVMRCVGGVRIDHAMGLQRLWVIPEGAGAGEGVYLRYPMQEMLSIVAQQSRTHQAIVIGEDLGTVDPQFRDAMRARDMLGMEVLWFQREWRRFVEAERWSPYAAALTTTHDLPTIAGWWMGRDLDWLEQLRRRAEHGDIAAERRARDEDRAHLWSAISNGPLPSPGDPAPVIAAAFAFIGRTPCPLAVVSAEDVIGLAEQPNIPGTIDEHPNWRRRLPPGDFFAQGERNLAALLRGRSEA
jgi:4-alpha-glucanotransferase